LTQFRTELGKRWLPDQRGVAADQRRFVLAGILRGVVTSRFDHDLRDHVEELSGLVQLNAQLAPVVKRDMRDPRFLLARSGLYWQVELRDRTTLRSPSLLDALFLPTGPNTEDSQPAFVEGPTGPMRLIRRLVHPHHLEEPIDIRVGVDERLIDEEMTQLNLPLAAALGIVAIGLFGAAYAQIAYSLQPLARIRQAAAAVCSGRAKELPDSLPREVMPLVKGLNGMIVANQNMVERARVLAGNLAHALKMPLAVLTEEARELRERGHTEAAKVLFEQCSRMTSHRLPNGAHKRGCVLKSRGHHSERDPCLCAVARRRQEDFHI